MTVTCLLPGSPTLGWYLGVIVFVVVRGELDLDYLMFDIMHVQTCLEECTSVLTYTGIQSTAKGKH
jgi:hypothetical protein